MRPSKISLINPKVMLFIGLAAVRTFWKRAAYAPGVGTIRTGPLLFCPIKLNLWCKFEPRIQYWAIGLHPAFLVSPHPATTACFPVHWQQTHWKSSRHW
jgi:hypothetical protein